MNDACLSLFHSAEEITKQIDSCASLIALRLEGNTLGVEAAKAIGESLARHPEFKVSNYPRSLGESVGSAFRSVCVHN